MDLRIADKVAVVTGAAGGLGLAIASKLAGEGVRVALLDLKEGMLKQAVEQLQTRGQDVRGYVVDLTDYQSVLRAYEDISGDFGQVDILVNCAGGGPGFTKTMLEITESEWRRLLDINLNTSFNTCKLMTSGMIKSRWGRIINVSSVAALTGGGALGKVAYATAKAGVIGLTRSLARELAEFNISVNTIAPSLHITPLTDFLTQEQRDAIVKMFPLKRAGDPEGVGALVCFLVSDYAGFITGSMITVDGGWTMH